MSGLLDVRTVLIGSVASAAICTVVMVLLWVQNRRRRPETWLWLVDFLMQFVGMLLVTMRGLVPDVVSMVVANVLILGGTVLLLVGLERYLDRPGRRLQDVAVLVAFTGVQTYFALVSPNLLARNLNVSVGLMFITAECAWLMLGRAAREDRAATAAAGSVFLGYAVVSAVRVAASLIVHPQTNDLLRSGLFDTAVLVAYQLLFIGLTFSLILMVNRRLIGALGRDIEQRMRAEGELHARQEFIERILENAPIGFAVNTIEDGRAIFVSRRFESDYGVEPGSLSSVDDYFEKVFLDQESRERIRERIMTDMESGEAARMRWLGVPITTKDGDDRIVDIINIPLLEQNLMISTVQDVTEKAKAQEEVLRLNAELEDRVQERTEELYSSNEELQSVNAELAALNEELVDANGKLEEATRAKSDFLAAMSHELRTPLNSIIGFSGVLLQGLSGSIDEEQRRQIAMINNSGRHLLELINGILDLSKVESGHNRPSIRKVDAGEIVREMVETALPLAAAKGLELSVVPHEPLEPVSTDALRMGQIVLNLLGNAVKFTDEGSITVTLAQGPDGLAVTVADTGRGIAPPDLPRVFEDFYQAAPPGGGKSEGTGLGLAVSRRLAESIGATIDVTSELGHGSVFVLRLPRAPR